MIPLLRLILRLLVALRQSIQLPSIQAEALQEALLSLRLLLLLRQEEPLGLQQVCIILPQVEALLGLRPPLLPPDSSPQEALQEVLPLPLVRVQIGALLPRIRLCIALLRLEPLRLALLLRIRLALQPALLLAIQPALLLAIRLAFRPVGQLHMALVKAVVQVELQAALRQEVQQLTTLTQ